MEIATSLNMSQEHRKSTFPKRSILNAQLSELGEVQFYLIPDSDCPEYKEWKSMMEQHHYLRSSKLFGQQLKYLFFSSRFGLLGGMSFSSASWRLEQRDRLIGWSDEDRYVSLNNVVCNSRFLILPWIKVKNLASHILSLSLRHMPNDWQHRYGIQPALIETFVDLDFVSGTCYKAANWMFIGKTKGRGRNDSKHEEKLNPKDIYVYKLGKDFCHGEVPLAKESNWIEREFQFTALPNLSKEKRLISLASAFYAQPTENIPAACDGDPAQIKGAYRFFGDKKVEMEDILISHYKNTVQRAREHSVVLAVQDSTSMNYATHPSTKGLGSLSTKKGNIGIMLHDTLVVTPKGVPLGLLDIQVWSRDPKEYGKKKDRKNKAIEEKESYKWLKSFEAVEKYSKEAPQSTWVSVGDREADIYELFDLAKNSNTELLVRSTQNRKTDENEKVWDLLEKQTPFGTLVVKVPETKKRRARNAELKVRAKEINLINPKKKTESVTLWAILVTDLNTPQGEEPITWKLLSTVDAGDFERACEKVEWYAARWGIEVYHRTLKSGCKIEERQLGDIEKIKRCLAIDLVIAWRIFYLTMLGRETPDVGCDQFLEEAEWKALMHYANKPKSRKIKPLTLKEALLLIAALGGFVKRKGKEPGTQVIWRGLKRLHDMAVMYSIMNSIKYQPEIEFEKLEIEETGYG